MKQNKLQGIWALIICVSWVGSLARSPYQPCSIAIVCLGGRLHSKRGNQICLILNFMNVKVDRPRTECALRSPFHSQAIKVHHASSSFSIQWQRYSHSIRPMIIREIPNLNSLTKRRTEKEKEPKQRAPSSDGMDHLMSDSNRLGYEVHVLNFCAAWLKSRQNLPR